MKYIPRVILIIVAFISCKQSPLCYRTGVDYFPLKIGNSAIYSTTPSDKEIINRVTDSVTIADREGFILERNGKPEYWWKNINRAEKLYLYTINIEGIEDTIAQWWVPWLEFPFSVNNSWNSSFSTSKVFVGDTVRILLRTETEVVELRGEEYKIKIDFFEEQNSKKLGSYSNNKTYYEWYKPNLGMVKREFNDTTETMTRFISGNDTLLNLQ